MNTKLLPPVAVFEITYHCNHRCKFCYNPWLRDANLDRTELSTKEIFAVLDTLERHRIQQVTFSGGEPTTREDLFKILEYTDYLGMKIGLISNGRNIDAEFLRSYAQFQGLLSLSVPGIQTFAQTTGVDNVTHVLKLFRLAREYGIPCSANVTVSRTNLPELYENIAYPLLYGAQYLLLNRFMPGGRGMENQDLLLNVEELNEMLDVAETVLRKAGKYGHIGTELPLCAIREPKKYQNLSISSLCAAAKQFVCIDPGGYLKVCNHSPVRVCRYDEIDVKLESNGYWNRFICSDYLPAMCTNCPDLAQCHGGCREAAHVYTGAVDGPDPLLTIAPTVPPPASHRPAVPRPTD